MNSSSDDLTVAAYRCPEMRNDNTSLPIAVTILRRDRKSITWANPCFGQRYASSKACEYLVYPLSCPNIPIILHLSAFNGSFYNPKDYGSNSHSRFELNTWWIWSTSILFSLSILTNNVFHQGKFKVGRLHSTWEVRECQAGAHSQPNYRSRSANSTIQIDEASRWNGSHRSHRRLAGYLRRSW